MKICFYLNFLDKKKHSRAPFTAVKKITEPEVKCEGRGLMFGMVT